MSSSVKPYKLSSLVRHNQTHEVIKIRNADNEEVKIIVGVSQVSINPVPSEIVKTKMIESIVNSSDINVNSEVNRVERIEEVNTTVLPKLKTFPKYGVDSAAKLPVVYKNVSGFNSNGDLKFGLNTSHVKNPASNRTLASHSILSFTIGEFYFAF
jgi:hypothetical protein